KLLTPLGLRTLAPSEPGYAPRYEGDARARDAAYHQGTVWPWLMGPFVEAWIRIRSGTADAKREAERRFLEPLRSQLATNGIGHLSEIADGDAPHTPRGCPFQAWSLGEFLRISEAIRETGVAARRSGAEARRTKKKTPAATRGSGKRPVRRRNLPA